MSAGGASRSWWEPGPRGDDLQPKYETVKSFDARGGCRTSAGLCGPRRPIFNHKPRNLEFLAKSPSPEAQPPLRPGPAIAAFPPRLHCPSHTADLPGPVDPLAGGPVQYSPLRMLVHCLFSSLGLGPHTPRDLDGPREVCLRAPAKSTGILIQVYPLLGNVPGIGLGGSQISKTRQL